MTRYESLRPNMVDVGVALVTGVIYACIAPTNEIAILLSPIVGITTPYAGKLLASKINRHRPATQSPIETANNQDLDKTILKSNRELLAREDNSIAPTIRALSGKFTGGSNGPPIIAPSKELTSPPKITKENISEN